MSAFHGDVLLKSALVERLCAALAADNVTLEVGSWQAPKGCVSAILAQDADLKVFAQVTGLPAPLGLLIDYFGIFLSRVPDERMAFLKSVLVVIPVGAQVDRACAAWLADIHSHNAFVTAAGGQAAFLSLLSDAAAAHHNVAAGGEVDRKTWSALRGQALALSDGHSAPELGLARAICDLVERTAWPMDKSRSMLAEALSTLSMLEGSLAVKALGWTAQDQQEVDSVLASIQQEHAHSDTPPNYQALFQARNPELERRFMEQLNTQAASSLSTAQTQAAALLRHLEAARP